MKLFQTLVLFAGLTVGASLLAEDTGKEPVKTDKNADVVPLAPRDGKVDKPKDITEPKAVDGEKKSPFSPSTLMRIKAQKPAEEAPVIAAPAPVVSTRIRPTLEGVLVKDNTVLASFRIGNRSVVLVPNNSLTVDDVKYIFVGYQDEVATLRDEEGHSYELRVIQHASSGTTQRIQDATGTSK